MQSGECMKGVTCLQCSTRCHNDDVNKHWEEKVSEAFIDSDKVRTKQIGIINVCFLSSIIEDRRRARNGTETIRSLSRCLCINGLISIGHLLTTKDRRICLFFACHLSSLSSTIVTTASYLFNIPSLFLSFILDKWPMKKIDWKSTLNTTNFEGKERAFVFFHLALPIIDCLRKWPVFD